MNSSTAFVSFSRLQLALLVACIWLACPATSARADLVLGFADVTAIAGASDNSFDVTLTNNTASDEVIAGFEFQITAAGANVIFSDVNVYTMGAYIFGANSLFGPDIVLAASGNSVIAEDNYAVPNAGATLGVGDTLDLGHVIFALDPNTPSGPIQLTFADYSDTAINDPSGNNIPVSPPTPDKSQIEVGGTTVPEPATLLLGIQGLLLTGHMLRRRAAHNLSNRRTAPN